MGQQLTYMSIELSQYSYLFRRNWNLIMLCNKWLVILLFFLMISGCEKPNKEVINIGYIGPLTTRATDLGIAPSNAMKLAVSQYNEDKLTSEPLINFYIEINNAISNEKSAIKTSPYNVVLSMYDICKCSRCR